MNIKEYDVYIVQIKNVFLVGIPYEDTGVCRLSDSPYDAARFSSRSDARMIARMAGGTEVLFNPITGKTFGKIKGEIKSEI